MLNSNPWNIYSVAKLDEQLRVTFKDEIGNEETIVCKAIFESSSAYRLISPIIDKIDIQKSNCSMFKVIKEKIQ